jgi:hypothetical protein
MWGASATGFLNGGEKSTAEVNCKLRLNLRHRTVHWSRL